MKVISTVIFVTLFISIAGCSKPSAPLTAPSLKNNPYQDVIVTTTQPLMSFFNAKFGEGDRTYDIQIDIEPTFTSDKLIEYNRIPEEKVHITSKLVEAEDALQDNSRYYWRARAVDAKGNKGPWDSSRFYVDTKADDSFMGMVRIPVESIEVSSGFNPKNIYDLDDPGQATFWQSTPPGAEVQWVQFDLGKRWSISRIWMLSTRGGSSDGWLEDFVWQMSDDGETWRDIPGTKTTTNDTFRNILDFKSITARHLKLKINKWRGYAAQLNTITFYSPGMPPVPEVPDSDYVLLVGNQQNGFTFSELAEFVESLDLNLKTMTVPHYEVSMKMLKHLKRKPVAIILSGNNTDYQNLPMFEYNGEYEIIRKSNIPILGICCGHQQLAMAYGYTYARSMGWSDISAMESRLKRTEIDQIKKDPVFKGIPDPFTAVEIHGWAVAKLPEGFELIGESSYTQAIKNTSRMIYGEQFHAEIKAPYNQGTPYLVNFLKMALEKGGTK
ncbi:MAG: C26 family cysteine hydrolase domain-containing family [Deltaproteobacteria bacterium]|jgi:GMP synthase-like glutamine amidotransferase|nr:C26 family cysteine hydrolase domain-containing family [Deltaproteobacteria bacterium]